MSDELFACGEFSAQSIQHAAQLCDQFELSIGIGTEFQFYAED